MRARPPGLRSPRDAVRTEFLRDSRRLRGLPPSRKGSPSGLARQGLHVGHPHRRRAVDRMRGELPPAGPRRRRAPGRARLGPPEAPRPVPARCDRRPRVRREAARGGGHQPLRGLDVRHGLHPRQEDPREERDHSAQARGAHAGRELNPGRANGFFIQVHPESGPEPRAEELRGRLACALEKYSGHP